MNNRSIRSIPSSRLIFPWMVFVLGCSVAVAVGLWSQREVEAEAVAAFELGAGRISSAITERLLKPKLGLSGVKGLYAVRERVSRIEFLAYVAARDLSHEFPGVRGFGYIEQVQREGLNAFVAAARADGAPNFSIRQFADAHHADLYVVRFMGPADSNARAEGLDVGSEPFRRAALQQAIDSGEPTITRAIELTRENYKTPGVLLYLPVYKTGTNPTNADERRAALRGVLFAPILLSALFDGIPDFISHRFDFEIIESDPFSAHETLYYNAGGSVTASLGPGQGAQGGWHRSLSAPLALFGQNLTLRVTSLPAFAGKFDRGAPWFIFATLTLLSSLSALLVRIQAGILQRAEARALLMTQKLHQDELRWRDFCAGASDWFWETDAQHVYRFISDNFEQFFGVPIGHYVGRSAKALLENDTLNPPELLQEQLRILEGHLQLKHFEYRVRVADGSIRWIVLSALPQFDLEGRFAGYRGNGSCITDRKLQELAAKDLAAEVSALNRHLVAANQELSRQQKFLRTVADAVPSMIGYWDRDLCCRFANKVYERWFHVDVESILGMHLRDVLGERLFQMNLPKITSVLAGDAQLFQRETRRVDGTIGHMAISYIPHSFEGVTQGYVVLVEDITGLKSAENHLLLLNAELSVQARAATQASVAKTDFLANMSHEIRSPLNAILGLAYLLEQSKLDQDANGMVRKIRDSGRMLLGIISDILDMSKIEAGLMLIEQSEFDLAAVIDNVAVAMGLAIGEKDIELIVFPLPQGLNRVMGDPLRLQQVLLNLSSNAAKFTQAGQIELRIDLLRDDAGAESLRFCVKDTGIGISPEMQEKLFSAFMQGDTSTTRRFGGTGLGLSICSQLVILMGGEIGVSSAHGVGSEFWFSLPLQRADNAHSSFPDYFPVKALICDDSAVALEAVGALALNLGWQAECVDSGAAVVAHLLDLKGAQLPNVVVLNLKLQGMDGLATARAIREGVPGEECPIVIMATPASLATLARQSGAEFVDAVVTKPVTSSGLHAAVMQGWRHRAAITANAPEQHANVIGALAGVHVLVVDDSDINRDVAHRILTGEGAAVTLAPNGQEAIDWLVTHPLDVDLVLMDVQMPVMDGMEATRRLRGMSQFDDLPIVALTAGAFKSQQQAAMTAGMTEFVSKPFDVPLTVALIQRLRRPPNRATTHPAAAQASGTLAPLSLAAAEVSVAVGVLDVALGLKLWADVPTYQSYLRRFVGGYADVVQVLRAHLLQGELRRATALAHKLSGVAANLALPQARAAALELERVLGSRDDPAAALETLGLAVTATMAEIGCYAPPVDEASDATPLNFTADQQLKVKTQLKELLAVLDSDNPRLIKKRLSELSTVLPPQAGETILACVIGYDFRGAEAATRQVAREMEMDLVE